MNPWTIYFDGACEPFNPGGHSTYGWIIYTPEQDVILSGNGYVCSGEGSTNNVAEYCALIGGLKAFRTLNVSDSSLLCKGDSMLVVMQLTEKWRLRKPHLKILCQQAWSLLEEIMLPWNAIWIPREQNQDADDLSKSVKIPSTAVAKRIFLKKEQRRVKKRKSHG